MKTTKQLFEMIINSEHGTHGLTYELAPMIRNIENEKIREKMIKLNQEYNEWIDKILDEHMEEWINARRNK